MAVPTFPTITISPQGAGTATATIDTAHVLNINDSNGHLLCNPHTLSAAANPGYVFDHFEWTRQVINTKTGQITFKRDYQSTDNPSKSQWVTFDSSKWPPELVYHDTPPYVYLLEPGEYDYEYDSPRGTWIAHSMTEITKCTAVFKIDPTATGKIIYGDGGIILCNQNNPLGLVLYDDGTVDPN